MMVMNKLRCITKNIVHLTNSTEDEVDSNK